MRMGSNSQASRDRKTIILFANTSWYLWNFRRRLAREIQQRGFDVLFVAQEDTYSGRLREIGRFVPLAISRRGKNPIVELRSILAVASIMRREKPHIVLTWTPKPNIYSGLVSRLCAVNVVPNVAGLGTLFVQQGLLPRAVGLMYRAAFHHLRTVFFQNRDDRDLFVAAKQVTEDSAKVLPGSGVDLERFTTSPLPSNRPFVFLYGGRLLAEKGLPELVKASRQLRDTGIEFRLMVFGFLDSGNPSAIGETELAGWVDEGLVDFHGFSDHMEHAIQQCDCVVLPSYYREGIPRILLEAAASARPIITTDSVGCREAIEAGVTGIYCLPRDVASLAAAMQAMIKFSPGEREAMARAARRLAETRFDENIVIAEYLTIIKN